jgi:MFS transporter, MHS family, shikimate and dehydroshikimate transport protein
MSATPRARWPYVFISAFLGTAIEQYDFLLYGTASALVFNKIFFPNLDPLAGTIAALGTYAAGYFARGAGAPICGHFGDRIGRRLLTELRVLQGFAIGGEQSGAIVLGAPCGLANSRDNL